MISPFEENEELVNVGFHEKCMNFREAITQNKIRFPFSFLTNIFLVYSIFSDLWTINIKKFLK